MTKDDMIDSLMSSLFGFVEIPTRAGWFEKNLLGVSFRYSLESDEPIFEIDKDGDEFAPENIDLRIFMGNLIIMLNAEAETKKASLKEGPEDDDVIIIEHMRGFV